MRFFRLRLLFLLLIISAGFSPIFSQDDAAAQTEEKESPYKPVTGLETWRHEIDISGYEAGTYNIIIEGVDKAGNSYFEGPFDIYIDPESDKPVVNISNPEPQMKVNGNLNIIGTCVDDDGVSFVEIQVDEGGFLRAEGKDFWSYFLETSELGDGIHRITARGVDINGSAGNEVVQSFILDRSVPRSEITSVDNGALVNGKVKFAGRTSDLNGIVKLELSTDGRETFSTVPLKKVKDANYKEFTLSVDTRELEDGPHIYWLRGTDQTNSVGLSSFLFFVDNQAPALDIIYPLDDNQENGKFTVAGRAIDEIGVKSLMYKTGREVPVEIPLSIGDPYWQQEINLTGSQKADITFILTDMTGNITEQRLQLLLDVESDKPLLDLRRPAAGDVTDEPVIAGFVSDDDQVGAVRYSIDGAEYTEVSSLYSFNIALNDIAPGAHRLDIYAVDINGVESEKQRVEFSVVSDKPEIEMEMFFPAEGETTLPFKQAAELNSGEYKSVSGTVTFFNEPESLFLSVDGGEQTKLSLKKVDDSLKRTYIIPLKAVLPGYHSFSLQAVDKGGLISDRQFFMMFRDPIEPAAGTGFHSADGRFSDSGKPEESFIRLKKGEQIVFFNDGADFSSAEFAGEVDFLKLSTDGARLIIGTESEGAASGITAEVSTADGKSFSIGPFDAGADDTDPVLELTQSPDGTIAAHSVRVEGTVSDNLGSAVLEYSLNGGSFSAVELNESGFGFDVDLDAVSDGGAELIIMASDETGNRKDILCMFRKDSEAPDIRQLTPLPSVSANGVVTYIGKIEEDSEIASVEYSSDGENFAAVGNNIFTVMPVDLTGNEDEQKKYIIRLTDAAGNTSDITPDFSIDSEDDTPEIQIQIPEDEALLKDDFIISGMAFDDDEVSRLLYSLDGADFEEIEAGNNFEIPLQISELADNEHVVEVKAVDPNGVESPVDVLSFNVSKSEPVSVMNNPPLDSLVKGRVELNGISSDTNGVEKVFISYDNGNTYNMTEVTAVAAVADADDAVDVPDGDTEQVSEEESVDAEVPGFAAEVDWSYTLDTELLEDGSHSLLIKAVDRFGVEGLYTTMINIDNTAPVIELTEPAEGLLTSGEFSLQGTLSDNIELAEVKLELQHLEDTESSMTIELPLEEMLVQKLDINDFSSGWVNLRVTAVDSTGNSSTSSRNVYNDRALDQRNISVFSPSKGASCTDTLVIQGRAEHFTDIQSAELKIDGAAVSILEINESGFFSSVIDAGKVEDGEHSLAVVITSGDGEEMSSEIIPFSYSSLGPWIRLDNFRAGDFANDRPWLSGSAGFTFVEPPLEEKALEEYRKGYGIDLVEVSLDNGKTFKRAEGREQWRFRLETQELNTGDLWILVRARFKDGSSAVFKTMLIVDETPPSVKLLYPGEGMRFNDSITLIGVADDEYGLQSVSAALREGGKSAYQIPSFIQGLYIDTHFLGATYAELGVGLTFFDDNVKLQVLAGAAPPGRFTGMTLGVKLLANIAVLPWEYFFGYDFRNFSSSAAVGTTFEYFSMPEEEGALFGEDGLVLGALIAQAELVKYEIPEWTTFGSFSFYTEYQLWFISSDVDAGVESRISFGLRTDVF